MKMRTLVLSTVWIGSSWTACCLAAGISGTAYDVDGLVVPNARVLLMVDYVKQREQLTDQSGGFRFAGLGPGRYELQIKREKMFIFQNTVIVDKPDQEAVLYAVLPVARMVDVSRVSAPLPEGVEKARLSSPPPLVGGEVEIAAPLERVRAPYPKEAVLQGIEGKVALYARINTDGSVSDAIVLSSPHDLLSRAALESIQKARYRPMRLNGHPIACGIDILIEFTLAALH